MRKVIYSINQSLDGNCDHTKFAPDDELMAHYTRQMRDVDTLAYGRKLYELMVPYWPAMAKERGEATQADYEFAQAFAAIPHLVVFSRTLRAVEPANARLVKTDAAAEIARMKGQDGGDIHISGIDLASQLIEAGLVDEFRIVVTPVIAGDGPRVTQGLALPESLALRLLESNTFRSGAVALRYGKS